jgi:hypothetical protein
MYSIQRFHYLRATPTSSTTEKDINHLSKEDENSNKEKIEKEK